MQVFQPTASARQQQASADGRVVLHRGSATAVVICWLFVVFDGYDLIVYGNVISSLQHEWGISASTAGTLGSLAFVGMIGVGRIGAVAAPQIGGWLLAAGLGANSNFVLFALSALIASLLLTVVWKRFPVADNTLRGPAMAH